jgi:flagellar hook assembly protein FlgD
MEGDIFATGKGNQELNDLTPITLEELGSIHVGRNITDYAWDGTDEYGDRLANGVYLYRVISRINGEDIEHRDSGADKYFKHEFGKMYLMR